MADLENIDPDLKLLDKDIGQRLANRARLLFTSSLTIKIVMVIGGSALATVAQLASGPTTLGVVGIAGAGIAALGGALVIILEKDVSGDLEAARLALAKARQYDDEINEHQRREANLTRATELYAAMNLMRGVIELNLFVPGISPTKAVEQCLESVKRELTIAFGFRREEHYAICIYVAERDLDSGKMIMKLIAHDRSVPCEIHQARKWPEGVGVAGSAYATASEIIIPDLLAPELGTAFSLKGDMADADLSRHRSIIAVPIIVDINTAPWGVATATCGRAGHFSTIKDGGVRTSEALRALAGMVTLAVKATNPPFTETNRPLGVEPGSPPIPTKP